MSRTAFKLFLVATIALCLELTLIRWLAAQVRVIAYFPNLVLIAAFFGMGIGCLRRGQKHGFWIWPVMLSITVVTANLLSGIAFTSKSASEYFWLLYNDLPESAPVVESVQLPLILFFILVSVTFVPFGQMIATYLKEYQREGNTLRGYVFDLGGSLCGVLVFMVLSALGTFPVVWFTLALVPGFFLLNAGWKNRAAFAGLAVLIVSVVALSERSHLYSPYYALRAEPIEVKDDTNVYTRILTNGSLHQMMVTARRENPSRFPPSINAREGFHHPFEFMKTPPRTALVLGAGSGNDLATLLDQGVEYIDAVEIDPAIVELGRELHPDRPYDDERVHVHVTDARSFLNSTEKKYDLIVFGTLDSMTRLSALSNVRLDNFVYTLESLTQTRRLLSENGGVVLHFMVGEQAIAEKIIKILTMVFGEVPGCINEHRNLFNLTCLVGPLFEHMPSEFRELSAGVINLADGIDLSTVPTDDWPYLYLHSRSVGSFYLTMMAAILSVSVVILLTLAPAMRSLTVWKDRTDVPMFLFGAAFLLLNTKGVTTMGLVWGNTWLTNSIVFASVLGVLLVSTAVFAVRPLPRGACFAALFVSLAVLYFLPVELLAGMSLPFKALASMGYIGLPFFFAGACFAEVFRNRVDVPAALGWNVIGALVGGLLEYLNMMVGFNALYLLALTLYLGAYLVDERKRQKMPDQVKSAAH